MRERIIYVPIKAVDGRRERLAEVLAPAQAHHDVWVSPENIVRDGYLIKLDESDLDTITGILNESNIKHTVLDRTDDHDLP